MLYKVKLSYLPLLSVSKGNCHAVVSVSSFSSTSVLAWMPCWLLNSWASFRRVSSPKVYLGLVLIALYRALSDGVARGSVGSVNRASSLALARSSPGAAAFSTASSTLMLLAYLDRSKARSIIAVVSSTTTNDTIATVGNTNPDMARLGCLPMTSRPSRSHCCCLRWILDSCQICWKFWIALSCLRVDMTAFLPKVGSCYWGWEATMEFLLRRLHCLGRCLMF